ncbi:MAG: hypothetical protein VB957_08390 [Pseudomonadales bacterium]
MRHSLLIIVILLSLISPLIVTAEEAGEQAPPKTEPTTSAASGDTADVEQNDDNKAKPEDAEASASTRVATKDAVSQPNNVIPDGNNLKDRDLGTAFRLFQPSEEISADNAVPFPVDI